MIPRHGRRKFPDVDMRQALEHGLEDDGARFCRPVEISHEKSRTGRVVQRGEEEGGGRHFVIQRVPAVLLRLPLSDGHGRHEGLREVRLHVGEQKAGDGRSALQGNDDGEGADGVEEECVDDGTHVVIEGLCRDEELVQFPFVICKIVMTSSVGLFFFIVIVVIAVIVIILSFVVLFVVVAVVRCDDLMVFLLFSNSLHVLRNQFANLPSCFRDVDLLEIESRDQGSENLKKNGAKTRNVRLMLLRQIWIYSIIIVIIDL